jgi:hypothetical protein
MQDVIGAFMGGEPGDIRWLSYAQIAAARGISRASAVRMARRAKWRRQTNNAGVVTVAVPVSYLERDQDNPEGSPKDRPGDRPGESHEGIAALARAITALQADATVLRAAVEREAGRADRAEAEAARQRAAAQDALEIADALRAADDRRRAGGRWRRAWRAWRGE